MLADLGLAVGLKSLCENAFMGQDLECSHDLDDLSQFFTVEDQISIYRIFQEALNNVREHAQATKVVITAKKTDRPGGFPGGGQRPGLRGRQIG